ncbi:serine protease hepsin-like [Xenia sp. Carnegie-2017]|uniref:serine protease hepsin-like n=1 Tax=Xenia sp. Carnegie-2017 TaxID=2897299 RepID=UPI001F04682F|nr:serine protease hepsin-like [Xenia sp. Carnegie-2017]
MKKDEKLKTDNVEDSLLCVSANLRDIVHLFKRKKRPSSWKCEIIRDEIVRRPNSDKTIYIPTCDLDGTFARKQCRYQPTTVTCWYVDKNGKPIGKNRYTHVISTYSSTRKKSMTLTQQQMTNNTKRTIRYKIRASNKEIVETNPLMVKTGNANITVKYLTKCEKLRERRLRQVRPPMMIPNCTRDGDFQLEQCNVYKTKCWCVGMNGKKIPGTKVRNKLPECYLDTCGKRFRKGPSRMRRIVGGRESSPGTWPWQAMIRSKHRGHICGATLVQKNWLVTAASCFDNYTKCIKEWTVILGAHELNSSSNTKIGIEAIHIHPKYQPGKETHPGDYDIAILQMSSSARIPRDIMPLCLPEKGFIQRCSITGWGRTSNSGSLSKVLREAYVDLVPLDKCNGEKSYNGTINDRFVCAGFKEGGIDACHFDTGGPLTCPMKGGAWGLAGIVSWRQSCAQPHKYGLYTNVRKVQRWIEKIIT